MLKKFFVHFRYGIIAGNLTKFTYDNFGSAEGTFSKVWMFSKTDFEITPFIIFVYNVI